MSLTNLKAALRAADAGGYAVGAFNILDTHFSDAVLNAARELASPVIVQVAEAHFARLDVESIAAAVRARAEREQVDVVLHLDHGQSLQTVQRVTACGFTSVMFDGSHLPLEENIRRTLQIVEFCRPLGVSVEAELGRVGGSEGNQGGTASPDQYTDVAEALRFTRETGIDALAVAVGNVHGAYRGVPKLNFERLAAIRAAVQSPLVLHGGTGIPEDDFRKAISLGIRKINFFTGLAAAAVQALHACGPADDYPAMMAAVTRQLEDVVKENLRIFGSVGKAH